ncbi:unnamed protein product [Prunus armeniaca]
MEGYGNEIFVAFGNKNVACGHMDRSTCVILGIDGLSMELTDYVWGFGQDPQPPGRLVYTGGCPGSPDTYSCYLYRVGQDPLSPVAFGFNDISHILLVGMTFR